MFMTLFYSSMIYSFHVFTFFKAISGFLSWSTCLLHFTWHLFYRNEKGKLTQYKGLLYFFYQVYCCLTFILLNLCHFIACMFLHHFPFCFVFGYTQYMLSTVLLKDIYFLKIHIILKPLNAKIYYKICFRHKKVLF